MNFKITTALFALFFFVVSIIIFSFANSLSLGFADGAEFALVCKLRSVAHAPGFPAYVLFTNFLSKITDLFTTTYIQSLVFISNFYAALSCVFLFLISTFLIKKCYPQLSNTYVMVISAISTFAFATGVTVWHWSTMVEVYSLQMLTFAGLIFCLLQYINSKNYTPLYVAAFFISVAIANHHLTMVLFLPFLPLFFFNNFLKNDEVIGVKKNATTIDKKQTYFNVVLSKPFILLGVSAIFFAIVFYAWLFFRAADNIVFKFGNPDNASRLWYHLIGGSWIGQTKKEVHGIVAMRIPYFSYLFFYQFLLFIPVLIVGLVALTKLKLNKLIIVLVVYFLVVFIYQIRIDQFADTDAYMLFPFLVMSLCIPFGMAYLVQKNKYLLYVMPILLLAQITINYKKVNPNNFEISRSLMKVLDYSTPKNAVIIVSDWTLVSQFYYYQIVEGFRPDIIMMNYDLKFCNYKNFQLMYPAFYKKIQEPYNTFVNALGATHPQDIYNTGCNIDSDFLLKTYSNCITKIIETSKQENRPVLYDPKTFVFLTQYNVIRPDAFVSGCFVSAQKSEMGKQFLKLADLDFLNSDRMLHEPAAADKLSDIGAMLDFSSKYYTAYNDSIALNNINQSLDKLYSIRTKMKKNMKFLYRDN